MTDYIIMGAAAAVIIAALMYFRKFLKKESSSVPHTSPSAGAFVNCPVCGTPLLPGQNLHSKIFRPAAAAPDQLCYVYGCPSCWPQCKPGIKRTCPVCHKDVLQDGYLISRMFNKTKSGKPHVIINGCGNCNRHSR